MQEAMRRRHAGPSSFQPQTGAGAEDKRRIRSPLEGRAAGRGGKSERGRRTPPSPRQQNAGTTQLSGGSSRSSVTLSSSSPSPSVCSSRWKKEALPSRHFIPATRLSAINQAARAARRCLSRSLPHISMAPAPAPAPAPPGRPS